MSWNEWVIDVSFYPGRDGLYCFCPIEDECVITGMNLLASTLDKGRKLVGVFHEGGQEAVDAWWENHSEEFKELQARINGS